MKRFLLMSIVILLLFPVVAVAEDDIIYTLYDEGGALLTYYCGECEIGDEYISSDNRHYRVVSIDEQNRFAKTECLGNAEMPDVSWLQIDASQPVSALSNKRVALYCTHSDESYIKGDGTQSVEGSGGIYDIASALGTSLEKLGATVEISKDTHLPHDAGAYRRSRSTAVQLLKSAPNAIFDIHRDGIPDPEEYAVTIGNEKMSKVRLLVGKSNQNKEANLSFAKQLKAVADNTYPNLIKDIYMGKGTYNQDLAPRSVLLEFGTHTLEKERVLKSVAPMSEVIYKTLFGGIIGSAGASDVSRSKTSAAQEDETAAPAQNDQTGASWIIWLILILVGGLGLFALLSTGGKGGMRKWGRSISEMTGGLLGKKSNHKDQP